MSIDKKTTKFQQLYDFDYYAGSQISIFIGDVFIDDIASIGWNMTQTKKPIYGYASYNYDRVAPGQVLVNGAFTVNFKERGYLYVILERYNRLLNTANNPNGKTSRTGDLPEVGLRKNIERLMAQSEVHPNFAFDTNDLRFLSSLNDLPEVEFDIVSSMFEEAAWGEQSVDVVDRKTGRNLKSGEPVPSDSRGNVLIRPDQFPPFDIVVGYGDVLRDKPTGSKRRNSNSTTKRIYDVDLIGESQVISINGEPIQEQYDFFARTIL